MLVGDTVWGGGCLIHRVNGGCGFGVGYSCYAVEGQQ